MTITDYPKLRELSDEQVARHQDLREATSTLDSVAAARVEAMIDQSVASHERCPDAVAPCPPWCIYEAGHEYDSITKDGRFVRFHAAESTAGVNLSQEETIAPDGTVTLGRVGIDVSVDDSLELGEARDVAEAILRMLEEIGS